MQKTSDATRLASAAKQEKSEHGEAEKPSLSKSGTRFAYMIILSNFATRNT